MSSSNLCVETPTPLIHFFIAKIAFTLYSGNMTWTVKILSSEVKAELDGLPRDIRAKFEHIVKLIQEFGLEHVHGPYIKHLEGRLWEMRMRGRDGIARVVYVTATGKRLVVVRAFRKKTQKTPRREVMLALKRAEEVT